MPDNADNKKKCNGKKWRYVDAVKVARKKMHRDQFLFLL